ncbi:3-oxoacyl-[acyl-carrier-protein] synthase III C-terminal domain-containing protein [Pseudoxanthomonas sp. JBR18]|uniref:3-oxoacyl-[acyl-carrier-protein] synthase III C-terminal domain-containing protein n=1 Tax=Pseudoxanthomonas sp. JBR18 TaxID=2969308 RepID=UPI0023067380|nr:3-oxoacyl-[acyl-carrier-protein] synthase III C-terminal domain-containing protein [Pseudoxanthomonas sp. JBR18]WCE05687.1 3-oxoacyl-[acyl-carrier-protein] synthase III C-terminal domain-containing protein [Pseudoxanthomonas sp. JBR18]
MSSPSPPALGVRIISSGIYVPRERVDSSRFDQSLGKPAGWTQRHMGMTERPHAGPGETSSWMGAQAARQALGSAGLEANQVDVVISACGVMEQALPCTAALIHRELGLAGSGIGAFDVNASCLSFLSALDLASLAIAGGRYRRVLIVSSEVATAGLNWDDPDTAPLFGDGAAAVVLEADATGRSAVLAAHLQTFSEGADHCRVRAGGTRLRVADDPQAYLAAARFEMAGKPTYRLAAQKLPKFIDGLLQRAGVALGELRCIVPHQASSKALRHLERALGLPSALLVRILDTHGNQMAASIPTALHHALSAGRVRRGDTIALVGSGAGLSLGGVVLRY